MPMEVPASIGTPPGDFLSPWNFIAAASWWSAAKLEVTKCCFVSDKRWRRCDESRVSFGLDFSDIFAGFPASSDDDGTRFFLSC